MSPPCQLHVLPLKLHEPLVLHVLGLQNAVGHVQDVQPRVLSPGVLSRGRCVRFVLGGVGARVMHGLRCS